MARIETFEDLIVWQKSHQLVLQIYRITNEFPSEEKFGLISQMRRAQISVPANTAEGFKKRGIRDKKKFYNISQASAEELKYYLILSKDLGYIESFTTTRDLINEIGRMLNKLSQMKEK